MTELLHQCLLRRGGSETVGWIEARGARPGVRVELKTEGFNDGLWQVVKVFQYIKPEDAQALSAAAASGASAPAVTPIDDNPTVGAVPDSSVSSKPLDGTSAAPVKNSDVHPGNPSKTTVK